MANTFPTFLAECGEVSVICPGTFRTRPAKPRPDIHPHPRRRPMLWISHGKRKTYLKIQGKSVTFASVK